MEYIQYIMGWNALAAVRQVNGSERSRSGLQYLYLPMQYPSEASYAG